MNQFDDNTTQMPQWLWLLQNEIARKLPDERSGVWLTRLSNAVETNTNMEDCKHRFLARLLRECLVFYRDAYPECATAIDGIAELHDVWREIDVDIWTEYAEYARSEARSAAKSQKRSAAQCAALCASWSTADSTAESALRAAEYAAWSAAEPSWVAIKHAALSAIEYAAWSAESAAWMNIANILIEEVER